jgi:glycerol-1-phosphate dehydrogenase [NAD(P)+]
MRMELYGGETCACGKKHVCNVHEIVVEDGALRTLPSLLGKAGATKPFLVMDVHTEKAAGCMVREILSAAGIPFSS